MLWQALGSVMPTLGNRVYTLKYPKGVSGSVSTSACQVGQSGHELAWAGIDWQGL